MIAFTEGDVTKATQDYICHQVNCQGRMNSGVAKAIRNKWPEVYGKYMAKYYDDTNSGSNMLGDIQIVPLKDSDQSVINIFGQYNYGYDKKQYTSYDAFYNALVQIKNKIPEDKTLAFPYGIGCGRGGARWPIILAMIEDVFENYYVFFYKMEKGF